MGKTVLICNHKGGVGKTMLAAHLAAGADAEIADGQSRRVVAIDTDPQASLSSWASRSQLAGIPFPHVLMLRPSLLRREWAELQEKYDRIVIDTAPSASLIIEEFAPLCDVVVLPVTPAGLELDALQSTLAMVPLEKTRLVLNRDSNHRTPRAARAVLDTIGPPVSVVHDYMAFRDATMGGGTVLERWPSGGAAFDARRIAREVWQ